MVLFRNEFTKVMSQHAGSECNGTHLIQCRRVNFITIYKSEKIRTVFAGLKIIFFPSNKGVKRSIAKYTLLQHILNVSFWKKLLLLRTDELCKQKGTNSLRITLKKCHIILFRKQIKGNDSQWLETTFKYLVQHPLGEIIVCDARSLTACIHDIFTIQLTFEI